MEGWRGRSFFFLQHEDNFANATNLLDTPLKDHNGFHS